VLLDRARAEAWVRAHVEPVGPIETAHQRPWATVLRVPLAGGAAWFKACGAVQAFEPRLSAELFARWPDRVAEVLDCDQRRGWLLLADAGTPIGEVGNPPEVWQAALPLYAELQRGEAAHAEDQVAQDAGGPRVPIPAKARRRWSCSLSSRWSRMASPKRLRGSRRNWVDRWSSGCGALGSSAGVSGSWCSTTTTGGRSGANGCRGGGDRVGLTELSKSARQAGSPHPREAAKNRRPLPAKA
jgi:hypothetical protein